MPKGKTHISRMPSKRRSSRTKRTARALNEHYLAPEEARASKDALVTVRALVDYDEFNNYLSNDDTTIDWPHFAHPIFWVEDDLSVWAAVEFRIPLVEVMRSFASFAGSGRFSFSYQGNS